MARASRLRVASVAACLAAAGACSSGTPQPGTASAPAPASASAPAAALPEVVLPDLSRVDATVREQAEERYATLTEVLARPGATAAERGTAYGNLAMLLQAGEYHEAAEPAYLRAQALMPDEPRWPYLLGHLHKSRGDPARAQADFARVLEIKPNDLPALIWLGRLYLDQGEADKAEALFERAKVIAPRVLAVQVGLGQAALARRDFTKAVSALEQALAIDPAAASVHSPLAMAYRGLGNTAQAEAHLKLWRNTDVLVPDPVRQELDLALQSGLSFELRGVRALEQRDFKTAAGFFRKGAALTPGSTMLGRSLRHKLATALYLDGDVRGAVELFQEVVRFAPEDGPEETAAKAHYSLGVLMASAGRGADAIRHLTAAVKFNPNYLEAQQALADALRRAGRTEAALPKYLEILRLNPRAADARFGYAMGLIRLKRYREAKEWLVEATRLQPDHQDLRHILARLLAAAPDDSVRDGARALAIVEELYATERTTQLGETMAMAYAEVGRFPDAVAVQVAVMEAASKAGLVAEARRMAANLRRYDQGLACRVPWAENDAVFSPGPPITPELASILPRT